MGADVVLAGLKERLLDHGSDRSQGDLNGFLCVFGSHDLGNVVQDHTRDCLHDSERLNSATGPTSMPHRIDVPAIYPAGSIHLEVLCDRCGG